MNYARDIEPHPTGGELVKVVGANNESEAEFLQNLLLEEGVSSSLRRSRGFDVPDFLSAGPRDVLVAASEAQVARDVLLQAGVEPVVADSGAAASPVRVLAGVVAAMGLVAVIVWLGVELLMSAQALTY